jgi:hypothetical protein
VNTLLDGLLVWFEAMDADEFGPSSTFLVRAIQESNTLKEAKP